MIGGGGKETFELVVFPHCQIFPTFTEGIETFIIRTSRKHSLPKLTIKTVSCVKLWAKKMSTTALTRKWYIP